uniref:NADH-ubiquinone oxidoreductase chain 2 n=1 Tax=Austinograea rodriguezensis TaxID=728235 RepID=M1EV38_AUSRO|nr:NADH dehydrogenase subunit 2 [Austinograea rodriguezensis]AEX32629.1 NADH dehydrogenase subunit 2 [Austinograea rodriguezensis]
MTFPLSYLFFFLTLILGTLLAVSSPSWFGAWIGLELNLLSFIPLITIKMNPYFSEAALKYFLIQALASTLIIMSSCLILLLPPVSTSLILMALLLKLGAAPFHFWFPQIMEGLSWPQTILLMTIQKFAPMFLISYLLTSATLTQITILSASLSAIAGALGGLNVMKLRKIMAFSSINHMSWMLIAMSINDTMWLMYFFFYSFISSSIAIFFHFIKAYHLSDLLNLNYSKSLYSLTLPLSLLSLGGLPPFTGFIPKWIMIQIMILNQMILPLFILLLSALVTLYFYLRIMIPFILLMNPGLSFNIKYLPSTSLSFFLPFIVSFNFLGLLLPFTFISM